MINIEKFTNATHELFTRAISIASENKNPTLQPIHLLTASLGDSFCSSFYQFFGINQETLAEIVSSELAKLPVATGSTLTLDITLERFMVSAWQEAKELNDTYISLEHILLVFSTTNELPSSLRDFWRSNNFTRHT